MILLLKYDREQKYINQNSINKKPVSNWVKIILKIHIYI